MKILNIEIENFQGHEALSVDFSTITTLTGANGTGKSSIAHAIIWAITGKHARPVIHDDASACEVNLTFEGGVTIRRRQTAGGNKTLRVFAGEDEWTGMNATEIQGELYKQLETDESRVLACLENGRFAAAGPEEKKGIVFDALGIGITADNLTAYLKKHFTTVKWTGPRATKVLSDIVDFSAVAVNEKLFKSFRQQCKRDIADTEAKLIQYAEVNEPDSDDPEQVQQLIKQLEKQHRDTLKLVGKVEGLPGLREQLREVSEGIAQAVEYSARDFTKYDATFKEAEKHLEDAAAELALKRAEVEAKELTNGQLSDLIQKMKETLGNTCVLSEAVTCPMASDAASKLIKESEADLKKALQELKALKKKVSTLESRHEAKQGVYDLAKKAVESYKASTTAPDVMDFERNKRDTLAASIADLEAHGDVQATADELDQQIKRARIELANITDWTAKKELQIKLKALLIDLDIFDAIAKSYGPRGLMAELLSTGMSKLDEIAAKYVDQLPWGPIKFAIVKEGNAEELRYCIGGRPLSSFSGGEQYAINSAVQLALAEITGFGLVIMDEVNMVGDLLADFNTDVIGSNMHLFDNVLICETNPLVPGAVMHESVKQYFLNGTIELING